MNTPILEDVQKKAPAHLGTFTDEQKEYLQGLMSGMAQRGLLQQGVQPQEAAEAKVFGTPVSELCKEERWKHEEHPLDAWDRLLTHAEKEQFPDPENTFRFKFFGLFYVAPAQNSFMMRCRLPGGIITSQQLHGLADIAQDHAAGHADITTRANFQIREILPKSLVQVLGKMQDLGLTSRGSGADNIRNITCSPLSGVDSAELYDCRLLAKSLHNYILNRRDLYGIPRKFNVAFDGGGSASVVADTNDIGFVAVRVPEGLGIETGVYFRVQLAGITGHEQFASDSGILVKPQEAVALSVAMIRVFNEHGDRTNRKKARLKYLIDKWGIPKFLEETEKKLSFPLVRFPLEKCDPRSPPLKHSHVGIYRQPQKGLNYLGVVVPVGRLKHRQMHRIADIAQNYGSGEVRLTVFQNLIIPNIPDAFVETVKRSLAWIGLSCESNSISGGLVACTGSAGCKYAASNTKAHAIELSKYLEKKIALEKPINIHFTGCPHSCAQHYIGDIGLLGAKVNLHGDSVEGYNVVLGGGFDDNQAIGREVFKGVTATTLPQLLEHILKMYQAKCKSGETFSEFTRRHEVKELQEMFSS